MAERQHARALLTETHRSVLFLAHSESQGASEREERRAIMERSKGIERETDKCRDRGDEAS